MEIPINVCNNWESDKSNYEQGKTNTVFYCVLRWFYEQEITSYMAYVCIVLALFIVAISLIEMSIAITWLVVFWYVTSLNLGACTKDFEHDGFYYYHKCNKESENYKNYGKYIYRYAGVMSTYLPVAMLIGYVCIFFYLKMLKKSITKTKKKVGVAHLSIYTLRKNSVSANKKEYALLVQSFLICGFIEVQNIAFTLLPSLPLQGQWLYIVNFVQNWISLLMSTMNPVVLFIFNKDIKEALKRLLENTFLKRYTNTSRGINYSSNVNMVGIWQIRSPTQYNQNPYF